MADRRKRKESDIVETAATVAVGAVAAYGCYKLCQSLFDTHTPRHNVHQSSANHHPQNSPSPSFGAAVSNAIGGVAAAHSGFKLCQSLLDALPVDEPQPIQAARPLQSMQAVRYPDVVQSHRHVIQPTRSEYNGRAPPPALTGENAIEALFALYGGYKLFQSVFGSSASDVVAVVDTTQKFQNALRQIRE